MPLDITIIRHAETEYNVKGLVHTHTVEGSITSVGIKQAHSAGNALKEVTFSKVFSSPMHRTQETGKCILEHLIHPNMELTIDSRLSERSYGKAREGTSSLELLQVARKTVPENPLSYAPPEDGESFHSVLLRIDSFFQELCDYCDKTSSKGEEAENILVITHGIWILAFFQYLHHPKFGYELANFGPEFLRLPPRNTAITKLRIHENVNPVKIKRKIEFKSIQSTSHLDELEPKNE